MKIFRNKIKYVVGVFSIFFLSGCAMSPPQSEVALNTDVLSRDDIKIGIYYEAPEDKATTHIWGANCLLCYAFASALTNGLDSHLESTISTDELDAIKDLVHSQYSSRFANVKLVQLSTPLDDFKDFEDQLGFADKDLRDVKSELDIDVLVVVQLRSYGAYRSFSDYVPNGDPKGHLAGLLYSVDLNTNAYLQYLSINEKVQPGGPWDEPPSYPNVTTAYYQAVENVKAKIAKSF